MPTITDLDTMMLPDDRALLQSPSRPLLGPRGTNPLTVVSRLTRLCEQLCRGDSAVLDQLHAAGVYLNEQGGWSLMQQCAKAVTKDRPEFSILFNLGWDLIGEWEG